MFYVVLPYTLWFYHLIQYKFLHPKIQENIYQKAADFRTEQTREVNSYEEFKVEIEKGGFLLCHWDGTPETEELIKNETKATIRCIPLEGDKTPGACMVTGKPSAQRVIFARAYWFGMLDLGIGNTKNQELDFLSPSFKFAT